MLGSRRVRRLKKNYPHAVVRNLRDAARRLEPAFWTAATWACPSPAAHVMLTLLTAGELRQTGLLPEERE